MEMVPYPIELYLLYKAVAVELLVLLTFKNIIDVITMPENVISDASKGSLVTRKTRVTVLASQIRAYQ
jgi:hypothetical protein